MRRRKSVRSPRGKIARNGRIASLPCEGLFRSAAPDSSEAAAWALAVVASASGPAESTTVEPATKSRRVIDDAGDGADDGDDVMGGSFSGEKEITPDNVLPIHWTKVSSREIQPAG
jgi:hypothetical protein